MYLSETYEKKWQPVLEHPDLTNAMAAYSAAISKTKDIKLSN